MPAPYSISQTGLVYDGAGFATMGAGDRIQSDKKGFDVDQSWIALRLEMLATPTTIMRLFTLGENTNEEIGVTWEPGGNTFFIFRETAGAGAQAFINDAWTDGGKRTVIGRYQTDGLGISVDGSNFATVAQTNSPDTGAALLDWGSRGYAGTEQFLGRIYWIMCGTGTVSNADAATIHGNGDTDPSLTGNPGIATIMWPAISDTAYDLLASDAPRVSVSRSNTRW